MPGRLPIFMPSLKRAPKLNYRKVSLTSLSHITTPLYKSHYLSALAWFSAEICDVVFFIKWVEVQSTYPSTMTSTPCLCMTIQGPLTTPIRLPSPSVDAYKHSLYVRSIPVWNALSADVVSSSSYPEFIRGVSYYFDIII